MKFKLKSEPAPTEPQPDMAQVQAALAELKTSGEKEGRRLYAALAKAKADHEKAIQKANELLHAAGLELSCFQRDISRKRAALEKQLLANPSPDVESFIDFLNGEIRDMQDKHGSYLQQRYTKVLASATTERQVVTHSTYPSIEARCAALVKARQDAEALKLEHLTPKELQVRFDEIMATVPEIELVAI